jgi:hypothetical protein
LPTVTRGKRRINALEKRKVHVSGCWVLVVDVKG